MEHMSVAGTMVESTLVVNPELCAPSALPATKCSLESNYLVLRLENNLPLQTPSATIHSESPAPLTLDDLPEEVIAHVFFILINDASPGSQREQPIKTTIQSIYRYLFILSSVCSDWRRICLSRSAFWSLIPFYRDWKDSESMLNLCLERAGGSDIHLGGGLTYGREQKLLELIPNYGPRIRTLNVYAETPDKLPRVVAALQEHSSPGRLSSLCLTNYQMIQDHDYHHTWPLLFPLASPEHDRFNLFAESLSSLRLWGFKLNWSQLRFSDLVDLQIQHIRVENISEVADLLFAIGSAPKLRSLQEYLIRYTTDLTALKESAPQGYNIDTLMTSRKWIRDCDLLRSFLKALPTIKTLNIAQCEFTKEIFQALVRPTESDPGSETDFPRIHRLHIMDSTFDCSDLDGLQEVVTSHRIQELKLGGSMDRRKSDRASTPEGWVRFEDPKDDERTTSTVSWLRDNVPKFLLVKRFQDLPDYDFQTYDS
ncbi:UDP-glycosyltransferase 85A1 [Rhizoctonia solani]|uniref:UDP-glycosyltransferase 85A1 n=1 Tax=Rhizoctonia solani TaxID=456999 RepID=A0A0K6FP62_9AGAM|nr:UDP-glycosyltransferase 85A1 [Rhizoctonia solani]